MEVSFQDVSLAFGEKVLFSHFTKTFTFSGVTALMGPSGSGKTTFFRLLCGLQKPDSGAVLGFPKTFTVLFQEDRLLPWVDALTNVALVSDTETAKACLNKVGLSNDMHNFPANLSGGMCRRVAIARALAHKSEILLLDEPLKGLDEELRAQMLHLLKAEGETRPVLLITHDEREAEALGAEVLTMHGMRFKCDNLQHFVTKPKACNIIKPLSACARKGHVSLKG